MPDRVRKLAEEERTSGILPVVRSAPPTLDTRQVFLIPYGYFLVAAVFAHPAISAKLLPITFRDHLLIPVHTPSNPDLLYWLRFSPIYVDA